MKISKVAIIMGSQSDLKVMNQATEFLKKFKVPYDIKIVSAHRTPQKMFEFSKSAHENYSVIIAGAGGAAHLPGMVAALTCLPVIGVPVTIGKLKGLDALLSIAQMPKGVPVATVATDNAANAGLLAVRILAVSNPKLFVALKRHQTSEAVRVQKMNLDLQRKTKASKARNKLKK